MVKVVGVALGAALMLSLGPLPAEAHKVIVFDDVYDTPGPPPLEQAEVIPPSPGEKVVWKPGHWKWKDGGWAWEPGRYEEKPVPAGGLGPGPLGLPLLGVELGPGLLGVRPGPGRRGPRVVRSR